MRILQIIDTLHAGGAERMAINYANALSQQISFSGLVTTRAEGSLAGQLHKKVGYLFLDKKRSIDFQAIYKLYSFVKKNKVEVVHAHSTSFFTAVLLKFCKPSLKLIWHDHYGDSEFLEQRPFWVLKIAMFFFDGVVVVNQKLKIWVGQKLNVKKIIYLPNFPNLDSSPQKLTKLQGNQGKRIVCLANLRPQKNHFLALDIAQEITVKYPDWSFHLVGKDFEDAYSSAIKYEIKSRQLEKQVFVYGSRDDVGYILEQAEIAILTSDSEGLPVALLEYGLHKKATVVTNVGEIGKIIQDNNNGFLVPAKDKNVFVAKLSQLIENSDIRVEFGNILAKNIQENFSEEAVIKQYLNWLEDES